MKNNVWLKLAAETIEKRKIAKSLKITIKQRMKTDLSGLGLCMSVYVDYSTDILTLYTLFNYTPKLLPEPGGGSFLIDKYIHIGKY